MVTISPETTLSTHLNLVYRVGTYVRFCSTNPCWWNRVVDRLSSLTNHFVHRGWSAGRRMHEQETQTRGR